MTSQLSVGGNSLSLEGPDMVARKSGFMRSEEKRLPLRAISSLQIERHGKNALLAAAGIGVLLALGAFGNESAGGGFMLLIVAGCLGWAWWATRTVVLVARTPTDSIEFSASGRLREQMEAFLVAARSPQ